MSYKYLNISATYLLQLIQKSSMFIISLIYTVLLCMQKNSFHTFYNCLYYSTCIMEYVTNGIHVPLALTILGLNQTTSELLYCITHTFIPTI